MIKQIIIALFASIISIFFIAQYDHWVQGKIGHAFKEIFEQSFDCSISFVVKEVNFFSPRLVLEQVIVTPRNGQEWQWHCSRYVMAFSWGHLFKQGSVDLAVIIDDLAMMSAIANNSLAIAPHLEKIIQTASLPIPLFLKSLLLKRATLQVKDKSGITSIIQWHSSSVKIDSVFKSIVHLINGKIIVNHKTIAEDFTGNLKIDINEAKDAKIVIHVDSSFELTHLGEHTTCYLTGVWDHNNGRFALRSAHDLCAIDPVIITKREKNTYLRLTARLPLSYIWHLGINSTTNDDVGGSSFLSLQAIVGNQSRINGQLIFEDVLYKQQLLCNNSKISFTKRDEIWHGEVKFRSTTAELDGTWHWCGEEKTGELTLKNLNTISIPYSKWWQLLPNDFFGEIKIDKEGEINGLYKATVTNQLRNTTNKIAGAVRINNGTIGLEGTINEQRYEVEGEFFPKVRLKKCSYFTRKGIPLVSLASKPMTQQTIEGSIEFSFIRSLIQQFTGYDLQGQGVAQLHGTFDESNKLCTDFHFADTTIRLPQTYNFINGLDGSISYDMGNHKLLLNNIYCSLYAGTIHSAKAVVLFDLKGNCQFAYVPLLFDHCLLNLKKDLFASISGNMVLNYLNSEQSLIKGNFIIDRAQLKENLFSDNFQKQLINYTSGMFGQSGVDMAYDVSIETKSPIRVDTDFLKADAKVALKIQKEIGNSEISGSIDLLSGSLAFPYKPLYITKGGIYFLSNQLYDPHIELVAKNKIKKYNIGLQVTGSLQSHHILFDSSPPLTEEQIIGLLLLGSEQDSMPALSIVQNVQQIIFGTNQSFLVQEYFKPFFGPFSSISLIPRFSDQSGRGGLRGALEIEINEQMQVLIQKNFSLTEDTKFELEYFFSDDITLRAIRDERRDIGGEVELRWKF